MDIDSDVYEMVWSSTDGEGKLTGKRKADTLRPRIKLDLPNDKKVCILLWNDNQSSAF